MKFIRDIINEKRSSGPVSASMPSEETQLDFEGETPATGTAPAALNLGRYLETPGHDLHEDAPDPAFYGDENTGYASDDDTWAEENWSDEDFSEDDVYTDGWPDENDAEADEMTLEAARRAINPDGETAEAGLSDPLDRLFAETHATGSDTTPDEEFEDEAQSETWEGYDDEEGMSPAPTPASLAEMRRTMASERPAPVTPAAAAEPARTSGADLLEMPAPAPGRAAGSTGRVKTRLLGFSTGVDAAADPIEKAARTGQARFPVGWMIVVEGPGRGASFTLQDGVSRIGRAEDQTVALNFGDTAISRENHVSVAYDSEQNSFYVGHSGKANLVRVNDKPLLSTETVSNGDLIRIGETTLRLVTLCGDDFSWDTDGEEEDARYA
ncbi:FHA domain-containing protein [uncultured Roseobacter sp.]|uniref:FHA domain-containing protein n=1 Tax=uncultured Roseobacter sp. TaxID=114847 RepID=UPI002602CD8F|nr:FHA domain-containing protein [uncultured Roseobacter sp.]